jgi:hypothetical protein
MATYQADHVKFRRLMKSDEIGRHIKMEAEKLRAHLEASAPRSSDSDSDTTVSHYADNFKVAMGLDILKKDRVAASIYNDSPYATALEVGSWNIRNPPMPMTKALDAFRA